jgi:N-formylmaleamate deformylase
MQSTQALTNSHTGDVVANGIRSHYFRTGGDKPPLVLLHGATDNGLCWTPIARQLEADYDVVLPDARGHGLSDAPEEGYTSAEQAADVAGIIRGLGLGPAAVGGHSMGAQTALRLAIDYPDLVRCAILEDPPFRPAGAGEPGAEVRDRFRSEIALYRTQSRDEVIASGHQSHPAWAEDELPAWADAKLQVSDAFLGSMRGAFNEPPLGASAARVTCPVLLITADPELGAIVTPETAEEVRRANPDRVTVARLQGAGHNVRREQSAAFMATLGAFLAREYALTR